MARLRFVETNVGDIYVRCSAMSFCSRKMLQFIATHKVVAAGNAEGEAVKLMFWSETLSFHRNRAYPEMSSKCRILNNFYIIFNFLSKIYSILTLL